MTESKIYNTAKELQSQFITLSEYEALKIATEIQRNEILKAAFNVSSSDSYPSALESIAMVLGYDSSGNETVSTALYDIAHTIRDKK